MVSLPSKWVKENAIQRGDPIYVEEQEGTLLLQTQQKNAGEEKEITFNIPTKQDFCARSLTMPYLQGYDVLKIQFKDPAVLNLIEKEIRYLVGFEIITTTENNCVIKNIAQGVETEFDNMLQRLLNILNFMGKDILTKIQTQDYKNILLLKSAEVESNKLSLLCRRMFNTKMLVRKKNDFSVYTMVTLLEAVADEYRFIIEYLEEHKPKLHTKTKHFFLQINEMMKLFNRLFSKFDNSLFVRFREDRQVIQRDFHQFDALSKHDGYIAHKLFNVMELVHHATYF